MKKIFLFLFPLILAVIVFLVIMFLTKSNSSGKGSLQVTSTPTSKVYLDGKAIGQTPLCKCELGSMLDSGEYTVRLVPEGNFRPFEQKITITKSTLTVVDATFENSTTEGSVISLIPLKNKKDMELSIISFPDKSNVFLDSNFMGTTPLLINNTTESDHDLRISKDGYRDKLIKISTHTGYKLEAIIYMGINPAVISDMPENSSSSAGLATPSAELSVQQILIKSSIGYVNVRDEGSLSGSKVGQVNNGETYDLVEEKDGWYQIKLSDEKLGWISSSYAIKQ